MPFQDNDTRRGPLGKLYRRAFMKAGSVAALGGIAGTATATAGETKPDGETGALQEDGSTSSKRMETARRVSPRDFSNHNYERIHSHRKTEALEVLLSEPEINEVAREWIGSFEAYEPLNNHLEMIAVQGPRDVQIEGSLTEDFEITAVDRQTAYGLVDRYANELVAVQLNEPTDASWMEKYSKDEIQRCQVVLEQDEVQSYLEGKDWWPMFKVAESITAFEDYAHAEAGPVAIYAIDDDGGSVVSSWFDVADPDNPKFIDSIVIEEFVEHPPQQIARKVRPNEESVLDKLPNVPEEKRPFYVANNGYHRFDLPPETFEQNNWKVHWKPPVTEGITMQAEYRGKPVFEAMNSPTTFTGYMLPPRNGRSTQEWYFPDETPVFNGDLLFWDIHSIDFGGPGMIARVDYPERDARPAGFRLKSHFHTGAEGKSSLDFHSGMRFGPYNYDISYEFFADGTIRPIWRRAGPGYLTEMLRKHEEHASWDAGRTDNEHVIQHYTSAQAIDVTPGTTDGVTIRRFDGDDWCTPDEEFYEQGDSTKIVRFTNPDGPETIEIPLDEDKELVVVRREPGEIGPAEMQAERAVDMDVETEYYHPSQYVDGQSIQGERVIAWLLMESATGEMPHYAGITNFAHVAELNLKGY